MLAVHAAHLLALGEHLLDSHPLHEQVRRVVGDRVIGVTARGGGRHHRLQAGGAVGQIGMRVQVTAQVIHGHQVRKFAAPRGIDLPAVLAQRRRDPGQPEPLVDLFLGGRDDLVAGPDVEQAVLGQLELGVDRDLPGADVVLPGPGEVLQRRSPAIGGHDPQVHLEPGGSGDRGLGRAAGHDPGDVRQVLHRVHQG